MTLLGPCPPHLYDVVPLADGLATIVAMVTQTQRKGMTERPATSQSSVVYRKTAHYDPRVRVSLDVSAGDLIDRITILQIKARRLPRERRTLVRQELAAARLTRDRFIVASTKLSSLTRALETVNRRLWAVEEALRTCERTGQFGPRFVALARSVYKTNDLRAALKRQLDRLLGSEIREQKSHRLPSLRA